jgi:ABC-type xylose transport system permease subunit
MRHQPLLLARPFPLQLVLAIILPVAFGALTGWMLSQSEIGYLVLTLLGVLGGFGAGYDHRGAGEGFLRGVLGGALFGLAILATHSLVDKVAKAHLLEPQWILVVITTVLGALLGAWGGSLRAKAEAKAHAGAPATA